MGKIIGLTFPLPQQEEANTQGREPHSTESDLAKEEPPKPSAAKANEK